MKRFIGMSFLSLAAGLLIAAAIGLGAPSGAAAAADTCKPGEQPVKVSGVDNAMMCCPPDAKGDRTNCLVLKYINPGVKLLAAIAGVAVVFGIMMGGIQYASSQGDPQKVSQAKGRIQKSLVALFVFFFMYSMLQFLSPGGLSANPAPVGGDPSAETCGKTFFGLKPWFAYLDSSNFGKDCQIENFRLLSDTQGESMVPPVFLAILDNLLRVAALISVAFVIIGGIKYTTSQGEPENTKQARETVVNALIGLVIAIIAASIVSFIGSKIV